MHGSCVQGFTSDLQSIYSYLCAYLFVYLFIYPVASFEGRQTFDTKA